MNGKFLYTCFDSLETDFSVESAIQFRSNDPTTYLVEKFPDRFVKWLDPNTIPVIDVQFIGADENDSLCFPANCNANGRCEYTCHELHETNFKI